MRTKTLIIIATLTVWGLLLAAGGLYFYDHSREDTIAKGVTVAGVPVGGLSADEARSKIEAEVAAGLEQPIAVTSEGKKFNLSAKDAGVNVDVGGMVDDAIAASREPSIFSRVYRDVTGGSEDVSVPPDTGYSRAAVDQLVARVVKGVDRPARDASVDFPSLSPVKEQDGLAVERAKLRADIVAALESPADRRVAAPVHRTKPKITTAEVAKRYPTLMIIDRGGFQLKLYKNLKLKKTYTIAVGQVGLETPAGLYHIQNKGENVPWNVPNSAWAGDLAGTTIPGGAPEQPDQGTLDGHLRRCRDPRHRSDGLARQRRLARLRAHGDSRRDRAVSAGARRGARVHPVASP